MARGGGVRVLVEHKLEVSAVAADVTSAARVVYRQDSHLFVGVGQDGAHRVGHRPLLLHHQVGGGIVSSASIHRPNGYTGSAQHLRSARELEGQLLVAGDTGQLPAGEIDLLGALVVQLDEASLDVRLDDLQVALGSGVNRVLGQSAILALVDHSAAALHGAGARDSRGGRTTSAGGDPAGSGAGAGAQVGAVAVAGDARVGTGASGGLDVEATLLAAEQLVVGGDLEIQGHLDVHQILVLLQLVGHLVAHALQFGLQGGDVLVVALSLRVQQVLQLPDASLEKGRGYITRKSMNL